MVRRRITVLAALLLLISPALVRADEDDAPKKDKKDKDKDGAVVAHIRLTGDLDESPSTADPLFGNGSESFKITALTSIRSQVCLPRARRTTRRNWRVWKPG